MKHVVKAYIIIPLITCVILLIYGLLIYWILPTYVPEDKLKIATKATQFSLTIATTLTGLGMYLARYLDEKNL